MRNNLKKMLSLSAKAPKPPGRYGKDHINLKTKSSPFAGTPDGLLAGMSRSDIMSGNLTDPTDGATGKQMLDGSRVYNKIVARIGRDDRSAHFYREHDLLLIWNGEKTIHSEQRSIYDVLTLAVTNNKIRDIQEPKFANSAQEFMGAASSSSSTSKELSRGIGFETSFLNLMSLKGLYSVIDMLGLPLHEITPGKKPTIQIARQVGGVSFTVNHEGRSEIGNLWGDNSSGSHVCLALNKPAAIDTTNPFKTRCHRLEPCTSRTSTGFAWNSRYGIKSHCRVTKGISSRKRDRYDEESTTMTKYVRGNESRDAHKTHWRSSKFGANVGSSRYNRNSLVIHCDTYNQRTITGTIFSLMRHEKVLAHELKDHHSEASKVPNTFLDWSVSRFDVNKAIPTGSQLMQSKAVYSQSLWRIVRHQAAMYKVGVVLTSQRGGIPDPELVDAVVYKDHECQGENMQKLNADNKLTIHVRNQ